MTLSFTINMSAQIDLLYISSSAFYVSESYESTKQLSDEIAKNILFELSKIKEHQLIVDKFVLTNEKDNTYTGNLFMHDNLMSVAFPVTVVYDGSSVRWNIPPILEWSIIEKPVVQKNVKKVDKGDAPIIKEKPVRKPKDEVKPDKTTTNALDELMNGPKENVASQGLEGNPNADSNAQSYYGTSKGLDGDGNYQVGGRKALNKAKFAQDCNEQGIVVVNIEVDRNGKVIKATPGVRGTTNPSRCLLEPAKRAALATKFNSDSNAPVNQIGKIIYSFRFSD